MIEIIFWGLLLLGVRFLCSLIQVKEDLSESEKKKVEKMLVYVRWARFLSICLLILFASPYHEAAVERIGGFAFILATGIIVIPLQTWKNICISSLQE